ncbi:zinc finger CCCH domain-containing protein 63-like isoform X2 [Wolffia australiana]
MADNLWRVNMRRDEGVERGQYPERPGEPDCSYYIRTGLCKFGITCRFNHPADRMLAAAAARFKGVFPERIGQPECQYYLRTGSCKFGGTCKFHHPKDKAADAGRAQLNVLGYPLRPNEKECAYYLRTGLCKFGSTCKFDHPQPSNAVVSLRGSSVYAAGIPGQEAYSGALTNWNLTRPSFITGTRWQGPSSYAQLILPQGMVQVPGWNTYSGHVSSTSPGNQQTARLSQSETTGQTSQGSAASYPVSPFPVGLYGFQKENIFPDRPGEQECQYYLKTGDCKFGAVCRFHHPRERVIPIPDCILSPLGLPLRPGETPCLFYLRYGICKFGSNCKFDHPMGPFAYGMSSSSHADQSLPSGSQPLASDGSVSPLS